MVALLWAAGSGARGAETPLPQVTIEAQRVELEKEVHDYVFGLTQGPVGTSDDPLQRWREPICFIIAGLPRLQAQLVLERISSAAEAAGAPLATEAHCTHPNFYVVFTDRPQQLLQMWRRHDPSMYGFAAPLAVNEFVDAPVPVRTWYNTEMEAAQEGGASVGGDSVGITSAAGSSSFSSNGLGGVPNVRGYASRIEYNVVRNFWSVIVLIDLAKVRRLELTTVADYVAMVGLARVHMGADVGGAPTVLRLFSTSNDPAPSGLTSWDKSFLKALYHTRQEVRGQRTEISEHILDDIAR